MFQRNFKNQLNLLNLIGNSMNDVIDLKVVVMIDGKSTEISLGARASDKENEEQKHFRGKIESVLSTIYEYSQSESPTDALKHFYLKVTDSSISRAYSKENLLVSSIIPDFSSARDQNSSPLKPNLTINSMPFDAVELSFFLDPMDVFSNDSYSVNQVISSVSPTWTGKSLSIDFLPPRGYKSTQSKLIDRIISFMFPLVPKIRFPTSVDLFLGQVLGLDVGKNQDTPQGKTILANSKSLHFADLSSFLDPMDILRSFDLSVSISMRDQVIPLVSLSSLPSLEKMVWVASYRIFDSASAIPSMLIENVFSSVISTGVKKVPVHDYCASMDEFLESFTRMIAISDPVINSSLYSTGEDQSPPIKKMRLLTDSEEVEFSVFIDPRDFAYDNDQSISTSPQVITLFSTENFGLIDNYLCHSLSSTQSFLLTNIFSSTLYSGPTDIVVFDFLTSVIAARLVLDLAVSSEDQGPPPKRMRLTVNPQPCDFIELSSFIDPIDIFSDDSSSVSVFLLDQARPSSHFSPFAKIHDFLFSIALDSSHSILSSAIHLGSIKFFGADVDDCSAFRDSFIRQIVVLDHTRPAVNTAEDQDL
jgi:hypothetical protein